MFSLLLLAAIPVPSPCEMPTKAALAFTVDSDPLASEAVEQALGRGCFDLVEVKHGSDDAMLQEAADAGLPWLVVAHAGLVEAMEDRVSGTVFSIDLLAFDVSSGERKGLAMRQANIVGHAQRATSTREAVRVVDDAVRVLNNQVAHPAEPAVYVAQPKVACSAKTPIVLLWHKQSDAAGRAAVLKALDDRCFEAPDQFDGDRAQATEFARDLKRPLLAVKTTIARPSGSNVVSHVLGVTVDVIDPNVEELKVTAHASDTRNALHASDDADAWNKVQASLIGNVLDKTLPR